MPAIILRIEPAVGAEILQAIEDEARRYVDEVVVRLRAEHVNAEAHVAPFRHAGTEIVDAAEGTPGTLIVMTSHGRSGLERTVRWYLDREDWWRPLLARDGALARLGTGP